jgi:hypothetical protein
MSKQNWEWWWENLISNTAMGNLAEAIERDILYGTSKTKKEPMGILNTYRGDSASWWRYVERMQSKSHNDLVQHVSPSYSPSESPSPSTSPSPSWSISISPSEEAKDGK